MSSDEKRDGSQRAIRRPRVPPGPLADLKALLFELYLEAGTPKLDQIEEWLTSTPRDASPGRDTVARIIGGPAMPPSYADLAIVVTVLARAALWDPDDAVRRARDLWVAARMDSVRIPAGAVRVNEADPRRLGVHATISVPGTPDDVPPEYVSRDADDGEFGVRAKVAAASERGGFVLLVGGSSVGKTRSAFEAVIALLPDWWLVHPAASAEVAALAQVPPSRTVVWLDELQRYLGENQGLTGAVIRALVDASQPTVVIGTLWPDRYAAFAAVPAPNGADPHSREREVLGLAETVRIDPEFTRAEQDRACEAAARDPRLRAALGSTGYGLTQTLAAAPQLVSRWQDAKTASPYGWALLTAALDTARLGVQAPITADLLRAAAVGYCTSRQQAEAPDNWFEQALAYSTEMLHGAAAALSPVASGMGQIAGYLAADYLVQHASRERRYARVPASTWEAVIGQVQDPADITRLAASAKGRLLHRYALPLYRRAAADDPVHATWHLAELLAMRGDLDELRTRADAGDTNAAYYLANLLLEHGDRDELQTRAGAGDDSASIRLAELLTMRCDLDELRTRADAGDRSAAVRLSRLLAMRGDLDELRTRADAGDTDAAQRLAGLLREHGDQDALRARADAGDRKAAAELSWFLAGRGDCDELRSRADAGDEIAAEQLVPLLEQRGDLDGLRTRADAGDKDAAMRLDYLLAERRDPDAAAQMLSDRADAGDRWAVVRLSQLLVRRGDLDGLRARADAGDNAAAMWLYNILAERGDLEGLRARADAGEGIAGAILGRELEKRGDLDGLHALAAAGAGNADMLSRVLIKQGRSEEAGRLRRLGLDPDGSIAAG